LNRLGGRIRRKYCPVGHRTLGLLAHCYASRLSGLPSDLKRLVIEGEQFGRATAQGQFEVKGQIGAGIQGPAVDAKHAPQNISPNKRPAPGGREHAKSSTHMPVV
jgi:hypothetical protein